MVIVAGNVWTLDGPKQVEELKVGDLVLDRKPSVREITDIEIVDVEEVMSFKNHSFAVSSDTEVYTAFGAKKITDETQILARREDLSLTPVTAYLEKVKAKGYKLSIKGGTDLFINGYSMQL